MSEEHNVNQEKAVDSTVQAVGTQTEQVLGEPSQVQAVEQVAQPQQPQPQVVQPGQVYGAQAPVGQVPQAPYGAPQPQSPYGTQPQAPYNGQLQGGQPYTGQQTWQGQPYQQAPQPYYGQAPVTQAPGNGKVIAALVCGIAAIVFSWTIVLGIVLGVIAIVLAAQYVKSFGKESKATGAKVCGIIGIAFSVIALVSYIFLFALGAYYLSEYGYDYGYGYGYSYDYDFEYDSSALELNA